MFKSKSDPMQDHTLLRPSQIPNTFLMPFRCLSFFKKLLFARILCAKSIGAFNIYSKLNCAIFEVLAQELKIVIFLTVQSRNDNSRIIKYLLAFLKDKIS